MGLKLLGFILVSYNLGTGMTLAVFYGVGKSLIVTI